MRTAAVGMMVAVAVVVGASASRGGEIYRWTDAQGVVHFADVPPAGQQRVETHTLPDAPPRAAAPAPAAPAAAGTLAVEPAQVVIVSHEEAPLGDTRHGISGTVKNQGGAPARDVVIAIHVISPAQGDDCLSEEVEVRPATLDPGAEGAFAVDLDHPCFRGPTQVDLRVRWE